MPACSDCREFDGTRCLAEARSVEILGERGRPAPLAACPIPIVEDYLHEINSGSTVLEVGCGSWSRVREHCLAVGAHYEGIDSSAGPGSVATRIENLADLSFPDESFDVVIGTQSMEHWAEYGCSVPWGLYQCFRSCRPGGKVLMNVPIHFHGTTDFMLGRIERLKTVFAMFSTDVTFESWGKQGTSYFPYPGYLPLRQRPAYVLDMHAVRNRPLPTSVRNTARTGLVGKLQAKPLSYVAYSTVSRLAGTTR